MRSIEPTDVPPYFWTISATPGVRPSAHRAKRDRCVRTAEAERVRDRGANRHRSRDPRYEIEITLGIDVDEVRGRWRHLIADRQHGEHRLDAGRGAKQVAGHRFRRRHGKLVRMLRSEE